MINDWPASLPQNILSQGYSEAFADNRIRTSMDIGPAKVRRRGTVAVIPIRGNIIVTAAQLETLETFYNDTLYNGALRFAWKNPRTEEAVEMRFTDTPTWFQEDAYYRVNLALEILP